MNNENDIIFLLTMITKTKKITPQPRSQKFGTCNMCGNTVCTCNKRSNKLHFG